MDTANISMSTAAAGQSSRWVKCGTPDEYHYHLLRGYAPIVPGPTLAEHIRRCDMCGEPYRNDDLSITGGGARFTRRRWYWIPAGRSNIEVHWIPKAIPGTNCCPPDFIADYDRTDEDMPPPANDDQRRRYRSLRAVRPA